MRRTALLFLLFAVIVVGALPSTAQIATRAPVIITASDNNDIANAHPFNPNVQIIVTGVETANTELSEPAHTCSAPPSTSYSLWFKANLQPGTLTLNTTGSTYATGLGTSLDTVISLYRVVDSFSDFGSLDELTCSDNGAGAGVISGFTLDDAGIYFISVSAAPGVIATSASTVTLIATYTADVPIPFDEPENARKLKFPSIPSIVGINRATLSLNEPVDPLLAEPITNSVWFKFTLPSGHPLQFSSFYSGGGNLWFSLFVFNGSAYTPPSTATLQATPGYLTAVLEAGTYFLRVAVTGEPAGSTGIFHTISIATYFIPNNYQFAVGATEETAGAIPNLADWTLKTGDPGPTGDGAFCNSGPDYDCYFQFTSSGPAEKTQLKSKLKLSDTKIKKGDLVIMQLALLDSIGTPDFTVTLKLIDANGVSQKFSLKVTEADAAIDLITQATANIAPVKSLLTLKNNDVVPGNRIEIDSIITATVRTGEGVLRDGKVNLLGRDIQAAWALPAGTALKGVLPAPPPAQ